jgi:hypothetical protein
MKIVECGETGHLSRSSPHGIAAVFERKVFEERAQELWLATEWARRSGAGVSGLDGQQVMVLTAEDQDACIPHPA